MCVCVNAIRTILQFTLVTHGHLFRVRLGATKGTNIPIITHNILIIIVLLCRCGPYMFRYVFPRTIWRVPYLSSNQKLLQMQEYTHVLMQLRAGSPPYVPYDALVPHACKQVLNTCPIETMNIIVLLLPLGQRLSTDKWPCHMEAPLVCTIHGANLIIRIMPLAPFRPFAIPNENIRADSKIVPVSSIAPEGWGPKEGGNATSPLQSRGSPNKGGQNQKSKPPLGVTMMPLGAPSISKYGSLVQPDAQIAALRTHCA